MAASMGRFRVPRGSTFWLRAALGITWALWLFVVIASIRLIGSHAYDFDSYYAAAQALRFDHSANIYLSATLAHSERAYGLCAHTGHFVPPYVYPPLLAILLEPLTLLPCANAAVVWLLLNAALWAVATLLLADVLARRWPGRRLAATTLMSAVSLGFLPAYYGLFLGQVHLLVLVGVALALWLVERGRERLAGASLAVVTIIKLFPAMLVMYYLARRRWRLVGVAVGVGVALLVVMVVGSSPATVAESLPAGAALVGGKLPTGVNEALIAIIPSALRPVGLALAALIGLTWLVVVWRRGGDDLLGFGWTLCAMLLVSPLVWSFYLVWLAPAYCACYATLGARPLVGWRSRAAWIGLVTLYGIMVLPAFTGIHPLATLALWLLVGALYWRSAPSQADAAPVSVAIHAVSER
ncbi:MAG TPA: glycosyltransferase family 87 protein [Ktedonobacterales bacterium]|nr:glycosyltransferase family 87 protein [Ktedonobacterales bacterium]